MSRFAIPLLLSVAVAALAGCDRGPATEAPDAATAAPAEAPLDAAEDFERTWLGVLPCADCDGIQTRLQLVRDGDARTYALEETYLGADGEAVFRQEGRWIEEPVEGLDDADGGTSGYRLDPGTPASRAYLLRADGALDQLDGRGRLLDGGGQYRLQRL